MNVFANNIELLQQKDPTLAQQVQHCKPSPAYQIQQTTTAYPTLIVQTETQQVALHHPQDPVNHATQTITRINDIHKARTLFIMDCGLGYFPLTLLKAGVPRDRILLFQPTLDVLRLALEHVDWSELLKHPGMQIVVGHENGIGYQAITQRVPEFLANRPIMVDSPNLSQAFPQWSQSIKQQAQDAIRMGKSGLATKWQVAPMGIKNVLSNLEALIHSHPIAAYRDALCGKPAVIVAAGPSLKKNIAELKKAAPNILIIATDTALGPLRNAGIEPHWVCSVDPTPLNARHFPDERYPGPLRLLYDPETLPAIVNKFDKRALAMIDKHEFFSWMNGELNDVGVVRKGSMVSESALLSAAYLGCDPIILIGQDLALDPETLASHHSDAALCRTMQAVENDQNAIIVPHLDGTGSNKDPLYWVEGVNGQPVPTVQSFYIYIRQMEQCIHQLSLNVIDATEGGALIKGTQIMPLHEALEQNGSNDVDLRAELASLEDSLPAKLDQSPDHLRQHMQKLIQHRLEFAEKAIQSLSNIQEYSLQQIQAISERVRKEIFNDPIAEYLIESAAPQELFSFLNRGAADASAEEQKQIMVRRVRALLEATRAAQSRLEAYLNG